MANFRPNLRPFIDWRPTPGYTEPYLTFTRASTAYEIDSTGTLASKGNNVLRDRFNPNTLAYEGKWFEPAATNLCLQSEVMGTTWTQDDLTDGVNAIAAPDGNTTADSLIEDATSADHIIHQSITKAASAIEYTFSCFLKAGTRSEAWLAMDDGTTTNYVNAHFDLGAGTVDGNVKAGNFTVGTASIVAYPNSWYRCEISGTTSTGTTLRPVISMDDGNASTYFTSYAGDGSSLLYAWGAQVETGARASSYIKTTTTSATRAADVCAIDLTSVFTNHNFNNEGTILVSGVFDFYDTGENRTIVSVDVGDSSEYVKIYTTSSGTSLRFIVRNSGGFPANLEIGTSGGDGVAFSAAGSWAQDDYAASYNGGTVVTDDAGDKPAGLAEISIGNQADLQFWSGAINRLILFNHAIPDVEIKNLTTTGRNAYWRLPRD